MIISHTYQFIFIHIYRTGGMSIANALSNHLNSEKNIGRSFFNKTYNIKNTITSIPQHSTAHKLKEIFSPAIYDQYYKFAFVRNPWDWQVSLYAYMLKEKNHFQHHIISKMKSFEDYIKWRVDEDKHLQKDFVVDKNDHLLVDFLGRFETIQTDFNKIIHKLGIRAKLPHMNSSSHAEYHTYYNNKTRDLIYKHFQDDIRLFGYSFK